MRRRKWPGAKTGRGYRLLSEAEWEYAARAGRAAPSWWRTSITPAQANYKAITSSIAAARRATTGNVPVDQFAPEPVRALSGHGNRWAWVEDVSHGSYADDPPSDGSAPDTVPVAPSCDTGFRARTLNPQSYPITPWVLCLATTSAQAVRSRQTAFSQRRP